MSAAAIEQEYSPYQGMVNMTAGAVTAGAQVHVANKVFDYGAKGIGSGLKSIFTSSAGKEVLEEGAELAVKQGAKKAAIMAGTGMALKVAAGFALRAVPVVGWAYTAYDLYNNGEEYMELGSSMIDKVKGAFGDDQGGISNGAVLTTGAAGLGVTGMLASAGNAAEKSTELGLVSKSDDYNLSKEVTGGGPDGGDPKKKGFLGNVWDKFAKKSTWGKLGAIGGIAFTGMAYLPGDDAAQNDVAAQPDGAQVQQVFTKEQALQEYGISQELLAVLDSDQLNRTDINVLHAIQEKMNNPEDWIDNKMNVVKFQSNPTKSGFMDLYNAEVVTDVSNITIGFNQQLGSDTFSATEITNLSKIAGKDALGYVNSEFNLDLK